MKPESKRWLGIGLIVAPFPLLVVTLSAYAISSFILYSVVEGSSVAPQASETGGDLALLIGNIVNVFLGAVGLVGVLGIIIGIPVGIVLLTMSETDPEVKKQRAKELQHNPFYKKQS